MSQWEGLAFIHPPPLRGSTGRNPEVAWIHFSFENSTLLCGRVLIPEVQHPKNARKRIPQLTALMEMPLPSETPFSCSLLPCLM